jgi:hypothetical protein
MRVLRSTSIPNGRYFLYTDEGDVLQIRHNRWQVALLGDPLSSGSQAGGCDRSIAHRDGISICGVSDGLKKTSSCCCQRGVGRPCFCSKPLFDIVSIFKAVASNKSPNNPTQQFRYFGLAARPFPPRQNRSRDG